MLEPITEMRLTSAELEVDAEFVVAAGEEPMVEAELLVEDISIDGMCGVY
jgi:mycofactocin precursor